MGLMDKFKNLFTDEEVIEEDDVEPIEIKEVKKEEEPQKLPTFMREKIEKEKLEEKESFSDLDIKKELKLESSLKDETDITSIPKSEEKSSFKFPIDFTENDFVETRSRQSFHHKKLEDSNLNIERVREQKEPEEKKTKPNEPRVADLYKDKKTEKQEAQAKKFRATPIISPIYGVLDKNYTPIDMENTAGENLEEKRHSKSVDFDSVRKKAYGSLSEEIRENLMCENCEYLKEAKECKKEKKKKYSDSLLYDVLEEDSKEETTRDITLDEATENYYDYGVEYEKKTEYLDEPQEEEVKIVNHEEEKRAKKEIPPVKSSINLLSTLKKSMGDDVSTPKPTEDNLELTDDLFNLIDSMYDERNENK